jgi:hypothetical protein
MDVMSSPHGDPTAGPEASPLLILAKRIVVAIGPAYLGTFYGSHGGE